MFLRAGSDRRQAHTCRDMPAATMAMEMILFIAPPFPI
jgi:hypothetical protein